MYKEHFFSKNIIKLTFPWASKIYKPGIAVKTETGKDSVKH